MILGTFFGPDKIPAYKLHRASQLGLSEKELYTKFTTPKEERELDPRSAAAQGSLLHRIFQATKTKTGGIQEVERFVYDPDSKVTGHIDLFSPEGMPADIKSVSPSRMKQVIKGGPFKKHISQLNFYLKTADTDVGFLQYVNRQNIEDQAVYKIRFDPGLLKSDVTKLNRVRARIDSELQSGSLNPSDLKMADTLEQRYSEAELAPETLKEDIANLDTLIDRYIEISGNGEFSESQINSNRPFVSIASRRAKNAIHGMSSGWFGQQRKERTGFGSPWDWSDVNKRTSKLFEDLTAYDIETTGLIPGGKRGDVITQVGFAGPKEVLQLTPEDILSAAEKHKPGRIAGNILEEIKKTFGLNERQLRNYYDKNFGFRYDESIRVTPVSGKRGEIINETIKILNRELVGQSNPIIIHTLQHEHKFAKSLGFRKLYHPEYESIVNRSMNATENLRQAFEESIAGLGTEAVNERKLDWVKQNFKMNMGYLKEKFDFFKRALEPHNGKRIGAVIDTQVMAQYSMGLLQEKGIIPKTYDIFTGTKLDHLSQGFFGITELHAASPDAYLERHLAPRLYDLVGELQDPNISKAALEQRLRGTKAWGWISELRGGRQLGWKQESVSKRVESHLEKIRRFGKTKVAQRYARGGITFKTETGLIRHLKQYPEELFFGGEYKAISPKFNLVDEAGKIIAQEQARGLSKSSKLYQKIPEVLRQKGGIIIPTAAGVLFAGAFLSNLFSGKDDNYNTIEGLKHGWFGESRNRFTDFGSGFTPREPGDPTPFDISALGAFVGLGVGMKFAWNRPFTLFGKKTIKSLSYMGIPEGMNIGRETATYGDVFYNAIRRFEYTFGGIPKTFSLSTMLSPNIYRDAQQSFDIGTNKTFAEYLSKLTGRDLIKEGITKVDYRAGKLYGQRVASKTEEVIFEHAALVKRIHDPRIAMTPTQFTESLTATREVKLGKLPRQLEEMPFMVTGAKTRTGLHMGMMHGVAHETLSKYLRLLDDPFKVMKDVFTIRETQGTKKIQKAFDYLPKLGVGGEAGLKGSVGKLMGRHAMTFLPKIIGIPLAYGMVNWAVRGLAPEDTVVGEAGVTGLGAWTVKTAHLTASQVSDFTGATALRKAAEEEVAGSTGLFPWFGLMATGGLSGTLIGGVQNVFDELVSGNRYQTMVENIGRETSKEMPGLLKRLPGFSKQYSRVGRYGRYGAAIGGLLGLPFALAGLGTDKSYQELAAEYEGETEVPVYKGRWWEFGMTPWKGQNIQYFRPNWYQRLKSGYKEEAIYGEDNISPLTKLYRDLADPYWLERKHYEKRPYPIAGPTGEALGIFGAAYEWTLGRVIKPPVFMHEEDWASGYAPMEPGLEPSQALGGLPAPDPISPYSAKQQLQQQYYSSYEAAGLRGFIAASAVEKLKGERELFSYTPILQPSADITSARRDFWDLNLGGGLGTTEFLRRFIPRRGAEFDYVNPIPNMMPSWLPGEDYFINFHLGDIYARIPEGEYRLPGEGYAARYPELSGLRPEDYPDIHKYKILGDVAMYSDEFRKYQRNLNDELAAGRMDEESAYIFQQTEQQLEDKRKKKEFRESSDSILANYYTAIVDVARASPLEQLLPIAPAHKFLPPPEPLQAYRESIYGREFKLWEHPVEHFIEPTISSTANLMGWGGLPEDILHRRAVEDYFDKVKYVKARRLQKEAQADGDRDSYLEARDLAAETLTGVNPYTYASRLLRAMPARERPYFLQFTEAPEEQRQEILGMTPLAMRDIYLAQWDNALIGRVDRGEIEADESELQNLKTEIKDRRSIMRLRRRAELDSFMESEYLPNNDWIGWRADVDLEDVKLKYVLDQGEDYHYYNLWENRLRTMGRKPYLDEALEQVNIPIAKTDYQKLYNIATEAGIQNPNISITTGLTDAVSIDLQQDRSEEIDYYLRKGRHIL